MYSASNSNPTLTNVTFSDNWAFGSGGGMFNYQKQPEADNRYLQRQLGRRHTRPRRRMANQDSDPILTNVTFNGNSASSGGGMYNNSNSNLTLTNVTFISNTAAAAAAPRAAG